MSFLRHKLDPSEFFVFPDYAFINHCRIKAVDRTNVDAGHVGLTKLVNERSQGFYDQTSRYNAKLDGYLKT